jgi:L-aminopeptidase/D-esterase-like protein
MRARDLGIPLAGTPGPLNAITDIPGVEVGMVTIIEDGSTAGIAARTGVTAILPLGRSGIGTSVPAGFTSMNGNGEMTGSHWIRETGGLSSPVMITNTHAVGSVHRGVIDWIIANRPDKAVEWLLPVVAETWDGYLNSINEPWIQPSHAGRAIDSANGGPVQEGSFGGGTGMNCYSFKGGNGTSSRTVQLGESRYVVAAFVQANFGDRMELTIAGIPMGDLDVPNPIGNGDWINADRQDAGRARVAPPGAGSVIAVIATDAPLLPAQCEALTRRVTHGLARTGTTGSHFSGDIFLGFSTANAGALDSGFPQGPADEVRQLAFIPWNRMDPFFEATAQCVEEAVLNALVNNADMIGRAGHRSHALPHDQVRDRLHRGRIAGAPSSS